MPTLLPKEAHRRAILLMRPLTYQLQREAREAKRGLWR